MHHPPRPALLLPALILALTAPAARTSGEPFLDCDGEGASSRCTLGIAAGLALEAAARGLTEISPGLRYRLRGDVLLRTPALDLQMVDANLEFAFSDLAPGVELLGTARVPVKTIPGLEGVLEAAPLAMVGLLGRDSLKLLLETGGKPLPLADIPGNEPNYLFFHFQTGLELDLGLAELLGLNTEPGAHDPFQYEFPGDVSLTVILDPLDPYFYISTSAGKAAAKSLEALRNAIEKARREKEKADQDGDGQDDRDQNKKNKKKNRKKKKKSLGVELQSFAFSNHGAIPFKPQTTWGLPEGIGEFQGHLFAETKFPLGYGVEIEGPIVARIGLDGMELGGNGDVQVEFPLLGDIIKLQFPLGEASAGVLASGEQAAVYFSGLLQPDTSFLPPEFPIIPAAGVRMAGYLDSARLAETRLIADGRFDLGIGNLGQLLGLKLENALVIEGELSIDRAGFRLRGVTTSSIHRDLVFSGERLVEAYFSASRPEDSYVLMSGDLAIGGIGLGAASSLRLSAQGLVIDGIFYTPASEIGLHGELTRTGPLLAGHAGVDFALDGISEAFERALAGVENAREKVEGLDRQIDAARAIVQAERDRDTRRLRDAQAVVNAAQAEVNKIQSQINANNSKINTRNAEIKSWNNWYNGLPGWRKPIEFPRYAAEIAWRQAEITALQAANTALRVTLAAAKAALSLAVEALRAVEATIVKIPIELDPRVAGPLALRLAALEVLRAAEAVLGGFPEIGGEFRGDITLSLSRRGIRGDLRAYLNGVEVLGGKVHLGSDPAACIQVAQLGQVCAPF